MRASSPSEKLLLPVLNKIERHLKMRLDGQDTFTRRLLAYTAKSRGKRLRARLALLAARAVGKVNPRVERLAAAVELLHQATLVHDDIIDDSSQRRHRLTLNARFGNQVAVLAGDFIFTQAVQLILKDMPSSIHDLMAKAATQVCLGEIQEVHHRGDARVSVAKYFEIVGNKTASLFAAACRGGAILAQASPAQAQQLEKYGRFFGLAFQIRDDVLDLTGIARRLGKPVGQDLEDGRITLPLILGIKLGSAGQRRQLLRQVENHDLRSAEARKVLQACGAIARAETMAQACAKQAQAAVAGLPKGAAVKALQNLAEFAVTRNR